MLTFGSLFAGIGGFDLGLERAGMECRWQVEINDFCRKVLAKHWPSVKRYKDIHDVGSSNLERVDLLCGGPPCQPASHAGKQLGTADNRWLWGETIRLVKELRPRWCVFENPIGILSLQGGVPFEQVCLELEGEGYEVQPFNIPACAVNAPHQRKRIWIVANADLAGPQGRDGGELQKCSSEQPIGEGGPFFANSNNCGKSNVPINVHSRFGVPRDDSFRGNPWDAKCRLGRTHDGISDELDECGGWECGVPRVDSDQVDRRHRIVALGNAVVPQVVEQLGRMILAVEAATE